MSESEIDWEQPFISTYYPKNILNPYKPNINPFNGPKEINFINTQPLPHFNRNEYFHGSAQEYENNYIKERYTKVKEENAMLKLKLFELEKDYKIKKGEIEEQILYLRDENSNLQLQIQKIIEKQKMENNISDNIRSENLSLINNINLLQNDLMNLKDDITRKVADIEEKNKIINDLRNEKTILLNDKKNMKIRIDTLTNDKETLLKQIKDLNATIGEKMTPKLKESEAKLAKFHNKVEYLKVENEKLKNDNLLLFNENNIQKNLIQILTKQNKKLLGEIKTIYDRDILLMDNMEKMGSNSSSKYKKIFNKETNKNENFLEEEKNRSKDDQKYIEENDDIKENNINEKYFQNDGLHSENEDIIKINDFNNNINNKSSQNKNNLNKSKNKREINSLINNDIIIKRNIESIENENNINKKDIKNELDNLNINNNINNGKMKEQKINELEKRKIKPKIPNRNKILNRNINFNSQSFTESNHTKNKFTDTDEDIKLENKTFNLATKPKIDQLNNDKDVNNEIDTKDNFYNTDEKINIKSKKNEIINKIKTKFKNNNYGSLDLNKNKNISNAYNSKLNNNITINADENLNNLLFHTQTKSQLSEYVEDLDVIQYK